MTRFDIDTMKYPLLFMLYVDKVVYNKVIINTKYYNASVNLQTN